MENQTTDLKINSDWGCMGLGAIIERIFNPMKKRIRRYLMDNNIREIATLGEDAVEYLEEFVDPDDPEIASRALDALGRIGGDEAFRIVSEAIQYPELLKSCVVSFRKMKNVKALPLLISLLEHQNTEIRKLVIATVSELKTLPEAHLYMDEADMTRISEEEEKEEEEEAQLQQEEEEEIDTLQRIIIDRKHTRFNDIEDKTYSTKLIGESLGYRVEYIDEINEVMLRRCFLLVLVVPAVKFTREELDAIENYVREGGNLLVLASWDAGYDYTDVNRLLSQTGMEIMNKLICNYVEENGEKKPTFSFEVGTTDHAIFSGIDSLHVFKGSAINPGAGEVILSAGLESFADDNINMQPDEGEDKGLIPVAVTARLDNGRILCMADYGVIQQNDSRTLQLVSNIIKWFREEK